ncbi:hypothetical protein Gohar_015952 [Gossypium harknessii]|uniref:DUF4283 domain-containing protein n=1 Tax=Gossypium harknessii TaxID=34285 RepID=A0A7J9G1D3_9ROSI|nr:hypothetical protein [Gossypium harknessii]
MENGIAGLRIDVEEEEAWLINGGAKTQKLMHEFFLVGCFLTASVVHFTTMRNTIPNIWHPFGGVLILDLGEKRFLFKFYHELDISRGHKWASWTFNNRLLVFHWLKDSEDPMEVLLIYSYLWVQIHDLPPGGTLGGSKGLQWTQDVEDTPIEELDRKKRLRVLQNVLDVSGLGFRYATL